MNTPMLNNFLAAFPSKEQCPMYGEPIAFLRDGGKRSYRGLPGTAVVPPLGCMVVGEGSKIASVDSPADFETAAALGYKFITMDVSAGKLGWMQEAITFAHRFGLGVIARNPDMMAIVAHPNTHGVIVERDRGTPTEMDALRRFARKDGLIPVWFVFEGSNGAPECADRIRQGDYEAMSVSYSTGPGYNDSHTLLLPTV